jgi:hypothetical protein
MNGHGGRRNGAGRKGLWPEGISPCLTRDKFTTARCLKKHAELLRELAVKMAHDDGVANAVRQILGKV